MSEWTDRSRPEWPRGVTQEHLDADADHRPDPESDYGDHIYDGCRVCGLAVTSDGTRHGWDES